MEIGVRLIGALLIILDFLLVPIFWLKSRRKRQILPSINNHLLKLSATSLADNIQKQLITSEELVRAYIDRIKEVNPILNAVVENRFTTAIRDAKIVDQYIIQHSELISDIFKEKPLLGIPVTIKESCSLEGMNFSVGSLTRLGLKAEKDGIAVSRLKAAGAIPLLVSNTPELGLAWQCNNLVTGATNNSYNSNYTSGGSSGGEGALLGAGASIIGLGSDIAGSIRIPAMFNGVFGHKPTPGLIPIEGHYPTSTDKNFLNYLAIGPMVRYAEDLKLLMQILTNNNNHQSEFYENIDISHLTIYYMMDAGTSLVLIQTEPEIKKSMQKVIAFLKEECCCHISNYKFKEMEDSCEISIALFFGLKDIPNLIENKKCTLFGELIKSVFGLSMFFLDTLLFYLLQSINVLIPRKKYNKYLTDCTNLRNKFIRKLGTAGVFLYPTFPTSAFLHGQLITKVSGVMYSMIFNVLGFPSTHVPLGLNNKGLPIGLQVVAAPNQDKLCIAIAIELEKKFGGWQEPEKV